MAKENEKVVTNPIEKKYYNYLNRPPKVRFCSKKPSKVQINPYDAKSPQEVLVKHGMYVDRSCLDDVKPFFADLTQFSNYTDYLNDIRDIKEKFNALDVDVRAKFNHNAEEFCNYITSKDFDIREIMTAEQYKDYKQMIDYEDEQRRVAEYLKSDEYKNLQLENEKRRAYEQAQYEEWKKQFNTK